MSKEGMAGVPAWGAAPPSAHCSPHAQLNLRLIVLKFITSGNILTKTQLAFPDVSTLGKIFIKLNLSFHRTLQPVQYVPDLSQYVSGIDGLTKHGI